MPDGWTWTTLDEVAVIKYGKNLPTTAFTDDGYFVFGANGVIGRYSEFLYEEEQVLISCRGAYSGKINISPPKCFVTNNSLVLEFIPELRQNKRYFFYALQAVDKSKLVTGTAQPQVTINNAQVLPLPLAPLAEQRRIVAAIESLFTKLEAGVAALQRAQANLRRYKASVLKAACEGRLISSGGAVTAPRHDTDLPAGWRWATVGEVTETIGGVTKGRNFNGKKTVKLPYLRVANVQRGRLDLVEMKEIELLESEIEKYRLCEGDVVLTEGGDWDKLGRSAIWHDQIGLCVHQNHVFRARVLSGQIASEWLMYYTNSEQGQKYFADSSKQTTNLASINLTQLRNCPIPLPPIAEQHRIVAEVERRLSVVAALEQTLAHNLARAEKLRQAILKKAFAGRLV